MSTTPRSHAGYRHIFWDMGGTIVNTYPQLDATLAGVVRSLGGVISDHDVSLLTRRSTGEAISTLALQFGLDESLFREAEATLKARWKTSPPPAMPGVRETMAAISGLNLVVTHRDRSSATSLLTALAVSVDDLICAPDGYPRKPDPAMHQRLLESHRLDPEDCVAIGDRPLDAAAASASGMDSVMLRTPRVPLANDATYQVENLKELLGLLA